MSLQTVLRSIESHEFAAQLGIANNMEMLFEAAQHQPPVIELLALLKDQGQAHLFLTHILSRLREQEDFRYRNSRDIAFAISIWALSRQQPALARLLASEVLSSPRLWWARRAAMESVVSPSGDTNADETTMLIQSKWDSSSKDGKDMIIVSRSSVSMRVEEILNQGDVKTTSATSQANTAIRGEFSMDSPAGKVHTEVTQRD